jgi:hypothetical protein
LQKRQEQRQAKKDYRKLLKKYSFKKELEEIEDYEAYYNQDKQPEPEQSDDDMD